MAQPLFKDPIVSSGPTLSGVGTGTLAVDKLTHFTTAQTYTATCIATSPSSIFSIVGSLDGPVGIATVGTQFFDDDLKIFLTIQQGATSFVIGDQFTFVVVNGTDLHQDNIDDYDELPQKNFGLGNKGFLSGDNNLRYSSTALKAYRYIQDIKFEAAAAGSAGNNLQVELHDPVPAVASTLTLQDLTFTAQTPGLGGDSLNILYNDFTPAVKASRDIQNVNFQANTAGAAGNAISVAYVTGPSLLVTVVGNAITVQLQSGITNASAIVAAVNVHPSASLLVTAKVIPIPANATTPQTGPVSPANLTGGANAIGAAGSEVVTVVGNAISVRLQSGVSTASQVRAAILASGPASALVAVAISGTSSNAQTFFVSPVFFSGGADAYGYEGSETAKLIGSKVVLYFVSGKSTVQTLLTALNDISITPTMTATLVGSGSNPLFGPLAAQNLIGGKNKYYSFNRNELTDSANFAEGNASVRAQDVKVQGQAEVDGHAKFGDMVALDDQDSTHKSGDVVPNAQQYINRGIQDEKIVLKTADDTKVSWSKPDFAFEADILISFPDTGFQNTIAVANSPISVAVGESVYVILDRDTNAVLAPFVSATVPTLVNAFRLLTRYNDNIVLWDNTLIRDGKTTRIGEGEGGIVHVDYYDPISTTLPSGTGATLDGFALANGDIVLFTALSSGNNRAYKVTGIGTSMAWVAQSAWSNGVNPTQGDQVVINKGTSFGLQVGIFNGTTFKFNDVVRFFNGTDYWELSSLKTANVPNNSNANLFTLNVSGSENMIIDFSVMRGTTKDTGTLHVTSDGVSVDMTQTGASLGSTGVDFAAAIVTGVLSVTATADASGLAATVKFFVRRWSNAAGGPAGIPNYASGSSPSILAAGANSQVQFNSGGFLGADSRFAWDVVNGALSLNGLQITALQGPITIDDNSSGVLTSFDAASYPFAIIEFSISRDDNYQVGRLLVANDGVNVSMSADFATIGDTGVVITATISGGNVQLDYISTSTGFGGQFKFSMHRWA